MKPTRQLWRVAIALLISIALNGILLAIGFSIDPKRENLSRIASVANALLRPAGAFTEQFAPGHGGTQILILIISSLVFYTLVVWVALSLPVWWTRRE